MLRPLAHATGRACGLIAMEEPGFLAQPAFCPPARNCGGAPPCGRAPRATRGRPPPSGAAAARVHQRLPRKHVRFVEPWLQRPQANILLFEAASTAACECRLWRGGARPPRGPNRATQALFGVRALPLVRAAGRRLCQRNPLEIDAIALVSCFTVASNSSFVVAKIQ